MSYTLGQRLGRLTVTRVRRGVAEQVRCDCGATIGVRLEFDWLAPPDEVGEYHARWLLAAEAGRLRYDAEHYRIHGVPNNAADARDRGLLVDAPGGPVLTGLGAHLLTHWKTSPAGRAWLAPRGEPAADEPPPMPATRRRGAQLERDAGAPRPSSDQPALF